MSTVDTFGERISTLTDYSGKKIVGLLKKIRMTMNNNNDDTKIVYSSLTQILA